MKTKKRFWKERDIKPCGCGNVLFKTIVKDKAYGCAKCGVVKVVTDPENLTSDDQVIIDNFRHRKMNEKEINHKRLVRLTKDSDDKKKKNAEFKVKKAKKKQFFDFSRFRRKPKAPVVVHGTKPTKTEKSTEKK